MKKIILLMPLMALTTLTSCGAKIHRNDLYKREKHYKDAGITLTSTFDYEYNDRQLCSKMVEDGLKDTIMTTEYIYDEHDNIKEENITKDTKGIIENAYVRYQNEYDGQGRIIKVTEERSNDKQDWEIVYISTTTYNNNVVEENRVNKNNDFLSYSAKTYDDQGNLINEKYAESKGTGNHEIDYHLNEYGCATTKEEYEYSKDSGRGELNSSSVVEYLENLSYRPTKEVITFFMSDKNETYETIEYVYNEDKQITLRKDYEGKEEASTTEYHDYVIYEY